MNACVRLRARYAYNAVKLFEYNAIRCTTHLATGYCLAGHFFSISADSIYSFGLFVGQTEPPASRQVHFRNLNIPCDISI